MSPALIQTRQAYAQVLGRSGEAAFVGIVGERDQECGCLGRGGVLELVG
jgi:hypothetical protein